jgi:hypothetical protein
LENGSPLAERNLLQSQNSEKTILVPTPSEDELMANLEWDEEDLMEYPEIEEGGIMIVTVNTLKRDKEAELSPIVCNAFEESQSISSNRSFTASPNTERYVSIINCCLVVLQDVYLSCILKLIHLL